jgi:hypothetical protein
MIYLLSYRLIRCQRLTLEEELLMLLVTPNNCLFFYSALFLITRSYRSKCFYSDLDYKQRSNEISKFDQLLNVFLEGIFQLQIILGDPSRSQVIEARTRGKSTAVGQLSIIGKGLNIDFVSIFSDKQ